MKKLKKLNYAACWPYLAVAFLAAYLSYRQMRTGNIIIGSDTIFHFNRFYETEEQIRNGNFSWFMTLYGFNQSGRVVNALYGPAFAYLNGLLLLAVGTWYRYQIVTSFLVYAIGGIGMYKAVRRFKVRVSIAVLVAIIYQSIGWLPRWQEGTNFTGIGAALMPYELMIAYDMVFDSDTPIHWAKLTILMTIALEVHLLTALMLMAFLDMTKKAILDYLPVYKWGVLPDVPNHFYTYKYKQYYEKENSKITAAYRKAVMSHNRNVKVKAVKRGLKLTWTGIRKQRLPVISYKQSKLTVNGNVLVKYKRNRVGVPTVLGKNKGVNTAYLECQLRLTKVGRL